LNFTSKIKVENKLFFIIYVQTILNCHITYLLSFCETTSSDF